MTIFDRPSRRGRIRAWLSDLLAGIFFALCCLMLYGIVWALAPGVSQ